jgi:hypothetical protein
MVFGDVSEKKALVLSLNFLMSKHGHMVNGKCEMCFVKKVVLPYQYVVLLGINGKIRPWCG